MMALPGGRKSLR